MRLKAGRPDLGDYTRYFDAPEAKADAPLTVTWAGVTTLLVDDGSSALMTDGFFSRPGLAAVGLGQIAPSAARIDGSLERLGVHRLEAVLPVHTHFDHAMDSAVVAQRTGARIVGGESAAQVGIGGGLAAGPRRRRNPWRGRHPRRLRGHTGRGGTLSAGPFSGCDHRACHPAGEDIGLQVWRGLVDARAPSAVESAAAGHRQRGLRAGRPRRIPGRSGVSGHRSAGNAARAVPRRLLDRDGAGRRRAPRRADPLGRLLPAADQAAARTPLRRQTTSTSRCGC